MPSTDILIKLAESFDVNIDYPAFESKGRQGKLNIQDRELLRWFEMVDSLSDKPSFPAHRAQQRMKQKSTL